MAETDPSQNSPDFSLVLGGPLYQIFRRARLTGPTLELVHRRVIFCPHMLGAIGNSVLDAISLSGRSRLSFFRDIVTHVRFLVALPVLILAEMVVHHHIRPIVKSFIERRVVTAEELPKFNAAIDSAMRIRNSAIVEVTLLIFVFTVGTWIWRHQGALDVASWYACPRVARSTLRWQGTGLRLSASPSSSSSCCAGICGL